MPRARSFSFAIAVFLLPGCGGAMAAKEAASPPAAGAAPDTIEEAQAEIARARAELGMPARAPAGYPSTGDRKAEPGQPQAGAPSPTYAQPPMAPPAAPPAPAAPESPAQASSAPAEESAARRCANLCRALASMRRAQEALCRLTGAGDARCTEGKRSVAEAQILCSSCGC